MDTLMFAPDNFTCRKQHLSRPAHDLAASAPRQDRPELLDVADLMWEMALRLEDGDLSQAERDLRAAQQQLREALERGADAAKNSSA